MSLLLVITQHCHYVRHALLHHHHHLQMCLYLWQDRKCLASINAVSAMQPNIQYWLCWVMLHHCLSNDYMFVLAKVARALRLRTNK